MKLPLASSADLSFTGNGVALEYQMPMDQSDYSARIEVRLDGEPDQTVILPSRSNFRKLDLYFKYGLDLGDHQLSLTLLNPDPAHPVEIRSMIVYSDKPLSVR